LPSSIRLCHSRSLSMRILVLMGSPGSARVEASLGRPAHRVLGVLRPGHMGPPGIDLHHGEAVRYRADMLAEITTDAFLVNEAVVAMSIDGLGGNRLVGGVLAGDVTEPALDAERLIDAGDGLVVDVEILPVRDVGDRPAAELLEPDIALLVHPV